MIDEWKPLNEEEGFDEIGVPLAELARRKTIGANEDGAAAAVPEAVPEVTADPVTPKPAEAVPAEAEPEEDAYAVLQAQFVQLEAERNRLKTERNRAAAERDAERKRIAELEQGHNDAQIAELQNHKALIEHAYAATNAELENAKRAYREARENGDIDAEITATEALSDAKDKLRQLAAGHQDVTRQLENPPKLQVTQQQQQPQAAPAVDDVDSLITDNFPHPKDQAWLRAHKDDIFGSEKRRAMAVNADVLCRDNGIEPHSDEYYEFLDFAMGYKKAEKQAPVVRKPKPAPATTQVTATDPEPAQDPAPEAEPESDPEPAAAAPAKRKAPLPGAPVSRSNGGAAGGAERASPALKQLADDLGMTVSEYMAYDKLIREGKTHLRYS
jgi:hypothetical protein